MFDNLSHLQAPVGSVVWARGVSCFSRMFRINMLIQMNRRLRVCVFRDAIRCFPVWQGVTCCQPCRAAGLSSSGGGIYHSCNRSLLVTPKSINSFATLLIMLIKQCFYIISSILITSREAVSVFSGQFHPESTSSICPVSSSSR